MGRGVGTFVVGILVASACCGGERADTWERFHRAFIRWYPVAWGSAPTDDMVRASQRRFDCVWERLERPADEFACVIRATDEMVRCSEDPTMRGKAADCLKLERQPCATSQVFKRVSWECSDERDRQLVLPP